MQLNLMILLVRVFYPGMISKSYHQALGRLDSLIELVTYPVLGTKYYGWALAEEWSSRSTLTLFHQTKNFTNWKENKDRKAK